ncbi:hypothetical protein DERP_013309 [Dermatophagoides pteronyssinus]|uniref:Uncharacterized protein n=1 Tax=Dermatophagoides pteronyssinus TaxID=6956 RepID=A0ABQ8J3P1_DERPT|nr:hypothetical protein DERP_013309 [Dermatophagoides pteronyssinus]
MNDVRCWQSIIALKTHIQITLTYTLSNVIVVRAGIKLQTSSSYDGGVLAQEKPKKQIQTSSTMKQKSKNIFIYLIQ